MLVLYVTVEVCALLALTSVAGIGWTILISAGAFIGGLVLVGSQARHAFGELRRGVRSPGGSIADGALIALGAVAVVIPGLISSAIGLLLLLPPARAVLRPALAVAAARQLRRRAPLITVIPAGYGAYQGSQRRTAATGYIDGEVVDIAEESGPQTHRCRRSNALPV